eukprot:TRINITY_DN103361_c0_g1_i1.p1 TRINITY_DN103361_c0_g1~~TRINITY_DN103361_c0_g1_i1.p1  ORF type:complete len:433 (-),score=107.75 TRINITY_DN103361_c0_g1_i1:1407-2654(-)
MPAKKEKGKKEEDYDKNRRICEKIAARPENLECFDCKALHPSWASINFGVFVCIRCSGFHRNLGTHISKVRSINLDKWTTEMLDWMDKIGNARGRMLYEVGLPANWVKPMEQCDTFTIDSVIQQKWVRKDFFSSQALQRFAPDLYKQRLKDGTLKEPAAAPKPAAAQKPAEEAPAEEEKSPGKKKPKVKGKKGGKKKITKKKKKAEDAEAAENDEDENEDQKAASEEEPDDGDGEENKPAEEEEEKDVLEDIVGSPTSSSQAPKTMFGLGDKQAAKADPLSSAMAMALDHFLDLTPPCLDSPPGSPLSPNKTGEAEEKPAETEQQQEPEATKEKEDEEPAKEEAEAKEEKKKPKKKAKAKAKAKTKTKGKKKKEEAEAEAEAEEEEDEPAGKEAPQEEESDEDDMYDFSSFAPKK